MLRKLVQKCGRSLLSYKHQYHQSFNLYFDHHRQSESNDNKVTSFRHNYTEHERKLHYFSLVSRSFRKMNTNSKLSKQDEKNIFVDCFQDIIQDVKQMIEENGLSRLVADHLIEVLEYNVPKGKLNRGLTVVETCKSLLNKTNFSSNELKQIYYLGWMVELLQAMLILLDDIMDHSETRRGELCWYRKEKIGLNAINDGLLMEHILYYLLKKYFGETEYYIRLVDLFHETVLHTAYGQHIDLSTSNQSVSTFSWDTYKPLVTYKTAFYTIYLPVAIALNVAGITDKRIFQQVKDLSTDIGIYFQIQDDYLDCFGDPKITGKIGTDIQDNKCTWLAVQCLKRATEQQKLILTDCYGQNNPDRIERVKELYKELKLSEYYRQYEQEAYHDITSKIKNTNSLVPHEIFYNILNQLHQRTK